MNRKVLGCAGCLTLAVVVCTFIVGIFFLVFSLIKNSAPYQDALSLTSKSAEVQAELGTPIRPGFMVWGSVKTGNGYGYANLTFPIHGPKGGAKVHCIARLRRSEWTPVQLTVTIDQTGKVISLDATSW